MVLIYRRSNLIKRVNELTIQNDLVNVSYPAEALGV
jgi:hypothetical protein